MKIRKSRLKEIIKEEVNSFKFIPINEGHGGQSLRDADETESQVLARMASMLQNMSVAAAEDEADAEGERMSHSPTGVLSSIAGTLQQLVDDDQLAEDFPPNAEDSEAKEEKAEAEANESTRLLDEIVVQEIIKALGEGPLSHTHQAQALKAKEKKQGSLGHNDAAALKYHSEESKKEKENA